MNKNTTAMLAAPSLRGPMRDSIGCDDENFSSPKESRLRVSGGEAPKHHLFQNEILNTLFCHTEADAANMTQQTVSTFEEMVMPIPEDMKIRFLSYMLAVTETAFEWGWKHANEFAEFKRKYQQTTNTTEQ